MTITNGITNGDTRPAVQSLDAFLASHPEVKLINMQYLDLSAVMRSRIVPVETLRKTLEGDGYHLGSGSVADMCLPSDNAIIEEIVPHIIPKGRLIPDVSTLRMCYDSAKLGNTAVVFASLEMDGLDLDPRVLLKRTVAAAEEEHGLKFLVGHEIEFCFMEMDRSKAPLEQQMGLHNGSFTSRSRYWPVLNEILVALAEEGLFAIEAHKEYGPTQFEIALPPYPPVESVDVLLYARELIKDIAYRHGLIATIYPHAFAAAAGHHETNGQRIHISATPAKESSSFDPDQFLGGLLSHIPALCAIGMASVDSYGRTARGHFGCGDFVAYGTNNRSTAIRLVSKNHWELRCVDATSNPYLMIAGMISAGLDSKPLTLEDIDSK